MCNVIMKTKNIKPKVFHPTPEHVVKSQPCLSKEGLHKDTVIMMYYCFTTNLKATTSNKVF